MNYEVEVKICDLLVRECGMEVLIFGSILTRSDPADLDILIVYEDRDALHGFVARLRDSVAPLDVDVTAMTKSELSRSGFLARAGAVGLCCEQGNFSASENDRAVRQIILRHALLFKEYYDYSSFKHLLVEAVFEALRKRDCKQVRFKQCESLSRKEVEAFR